jgi:hypothetical protein
LVLCPAFTRGSTQVSSRNTNFSMTNESTSIDLNGPTKQKNGFLDLKFIVDFRTHFITIFIYHPTHFLFRNGIP